MRCRSAGASRAMAWPMSSTRASATRSVRPATQDPGSRDALATRVVAFSRSVIFQVSQSDRPQLVRSTPHASSSAAVSRRAQCHAIAFPRNCESPAKGKLPWSKLVKYYLFNVFNMTPHSILCRLGIVALDRSQDPAVAGERLLRAPFQLQRTLPRFAQQVHEYVDHFQNDTVTGGQRNAVVEFRILIDAGFTP